MKTSLDALLAELMTIATLAFARQPSDEDISPCFEKLVEMPPRSMLRRLSVFLKRNTAETQATSLA